MSEQSTEELVVQLAAAAHHVDAAELLDSNAFREQIRELAPNTPGYFQRVADVVRDRSAASAPQGQEAAAEPEAPPIQSQADYWAQVAKRRAELTVDYDGPISAEDVQLAAPRVVGEWVAAGKLAHLGVPAQARRSRR